MIRIFQRCQNAMGWTVVTVDSASDPEVAHQVTISDLGYLCDCPGFLFRGTCRHKALAEANRCRWEEGLLPSQSVGERDTHRCPNCGADTILVAEVDDAEDKG